MYVHFWPFQPILRQNFLVTPKSSRVLNKYLNNFIEWKINVALESPLTLVLRGLFALNIHCRNRGHTTNILVENVTKRKTGITWTPSVFSVCHDADHTYYLHNPPLLLPLLAKWASLGHVPGPDSSHVLNSGKGIPAQCAKSQYPNFN